MNAADHTKTAGTLTLLRIAAGVILTVHLLGGLGLVFGWLRQET